MVANRRLLHSQKNATHPTTVNTTEAPTTTANCIASIVSIYADCCFGVPKTQSMNGQRDHVPRTRASSRCVCPEAVQLLTRGQAHAHAAVRAPAGDPRLRRALSCWLQGLLRCGPRSWFVDAS